jgi:hypothetical protein
VVLKPTGAGALWGKVQEVRDAVIDFRRSGKPIVAFPRVRRRAGVLPRDRVRQGVPDAERDAGSHRRRQLRAVHARDARQDRRVSRRPAHRRIQDGAQHVHGAHLHARAPRDGGVARTRISTSSWCAGLRTAAARARRT